MAAQDVGQHFSNQELSIEDIEIEDEALEPFLIGRKIKVLVQDVDCIRWKQELPEDEALLQELLEQARKIQTAQDEFFHQLQGFTSSFNKWLEVEKKNIFRKRKKKNELMEIKEESHEQLDLAA